MLKNLIIPSSYRGKEGSIVIWALIGLSIRLVLMPITLHPDLLEPYWAADKIVNEDIFNLGQYVKDNFNVSGANYLAPLAYIHAIFLWIFKPFIPCNQLTLLRDNRLIGIFTDTASHQEAVLSFMAGPHVFRSIFFFKLPYLVFDFMCAFLLLRIIRNPERALFVFRFWLVNFVNIFVIYIWGKYEIIPVFLVLLSIFLARKKRIYLSMLIIGLSVILKYYTLLFLLPFGFVLGKDNIERVKLAVCGMAPLMLLILLVETANRSWFGNAFTDFLRTGIEAPIGFLFNKIMISSSMAVYIFPLLYGVILWHCYFKRGHPVCNLERYSLVILLCFYAFCHFFPQYLFWMMPFFVLQLVKNKGWLSAHVVQILCFLIFTLNGGLFILKLFLPLNPSLISTSFHPPVVIRQMIHPFKDIILNISRTMFSATCLWMIYMLFNKNKEYVDNVWY